MQPRPRKPAQSRNNAADVLRLSHLRREVKTALELSVAALAHAEVIDALATAAGLLEALAEFPPSSAPVVATAPRANNLAEKALETWQQWQSRPTRKRSA